MNYQNFILSHPWVDLFLELFKGIMPTIIALLAIYINNKMANKRDKKKMINDMKIKSLVIQQENAIELNNMVYNTGKEFLDYMQHLGDEEKKKFYWVRFYESNEQMLMFARKISISSKMEEIKTEIDVFRFNKCFEKITEYSYEFSNIIDRYNKLASITKGSEFDVLLDKVQQELINASGKVEEMIIEYIEDISKIYKKLCTE